VVAVSRWRPLPEEREPPEPTRVGESLHQLAARLGAPAPATLAAVFARWDEIVGGTVAAHAWPISLSDGVLVIGVDQPAWASQLRFLGADLRRQLAETAGDDCVQRVEVKVLPKRPQ
jgi:predicted nucleic acid-binding Zn ribbon protein